MLLHSDPVKGPDISKPATFVLENEEQQLSAVPVYPSVNVLFVCLLKAEQRSTRKGQDSGLTWSASSAPTCGLSDLISLSAK
jgi:hypothetical protein